MAGMCASSSSLFQLTTKRSSCILHSLSSSSLYTGRRGVTNNSRPRRKFSSLVVRAEEKIQNKGMTREGPAQGGRWLSCTTRHIRLYAAAIDPVTKAMDQTQIDKLSLILDPHNEFLWPDDKAQKVYDYLKELVDHYAGAPLTEYTLRLVGSDLEHYIRKLLLAGEIKYNLNCRVLNFSMGKPRLNLHSPEVDTPPQ